MNSRPVGGFSRFVLAWLPPLVILGGLVFSVAGLRSVRMNNEDVLRWLPDTSPARADYEFFRSVFAPDDYVVISWPDCRLDDPRLAEFCDRVREGTATGLVHSVVSGRDVLEGLVEAGGTSRERVQRRLGGIMFGRDDPELTCVVVALGPEGRANRSAAVALIENAATATDGIDPAELMVAGDPWLAVGMGRMIQSTFDRLLPLSAIAATIVALLCLRSVNLALIGLIASGLAAGVSIALVPACGCQIGGLTMVMPTLSFVLTMSGTLHLTNYAVNLPALRGGDWRECCRQLVAMGWRPCVVSTGTTIIGVLTLVISDYPAVREFGWFSAAGLTFSLLVQLLVFPWLLFRLGRPGLRWMESKLPDGRSWARLPAWIERRRMAISILSFVLFGLAGAGLPRLQPNVQAENLFRRDSRLMGSVRELEQQIGPMVQGELLLVYDSAVPDTFWQRLALTRQLDRYLSRLADVELVHSLDDYLPPEPRGGGLVTRARQTLMRQALLRHRETLAQGGMLSLQGDRETWRLSPRYSFLKASDFAEVERVARELVAQLAGSAARQWPGFTAPRLIHTGTTQLVTDSQKSMLSSFAFNFVLAFVLITPVLMWVLRSFWLGVVGMLANLVPMTLVFGIMGWLAVPIDIALGMTASVALGIAVDDTTHLMIRFREEGGSLTGVQPHLERALALCGPAMLHTTLIACAGIFTFWLSELVVISRFAATISALLVAAVLADLFMLPATISVAGWMARRRKQVSNEDHAKPQSRKVNA